MTVCTILSDNSFSLDRIPNRYAPRTEAEGETHVPPALPPAEMQVHPVAGVHVLLCFPSQHTAKRASRGAQADYAAMARNRTA